MDRDVKKKLERDMLVKVMENFRSLAREDVYTWGTKITINWVKKFERYLERMINNREEKVEKYPVEWKCEWMHTVIGWNKYGQIKFLPEEDVPDIYWNYSYYDTLN